MEHDAVTRGESVWRRVTSAEDHSAELRRGTYSEIERGCGVTGHQILHYETRTSSSNTTASMTALTFSPFSRLNS